MIKPFPLFLQKLSVQVRCGILFACLCAISFFFLDQFFADRLYPLLSTDYVVPIHLISYLISPIYPLLFGSIFLILWLARVKHGKMRLLFEVTTAQFIGGGATSLLKVLVGRARPLAFSAQESPLHPFDNLVHSFPSGHTMAAFTLATTLSFFYPRFGVLFFASALTLSLSRVLLLHHYLSDLFGTALLAILLARFIHEKLKKSYPYPMLTDINLGEKDDSLCK